MESSCPKCFGIASEYGSERCSPCEFRESCKYCIDDNGSGCDRRLGHVSYERYSYSEKVAIFPEFPEKKLSESDCDDARRIIEFLLDIDNYTAELLSEVMRGDVSSASDLARRMGVSRQAIHRKIVDCCTLHPELRKLFITRLYRCRRILDDSKRLSRKKNKNQMEFNFDGIIQQGDCGR